MKILLTNDDGIDAEGLTALETAVRDAFSPEELWVVAPDRGRSQCAHATTAGIPVEAHKRSENRFAVTGFPADCVRIAVFGLGFQPDWIFSGINFGGNLGHDIVLSGTVAAAREAAYHGLPAAAVSHFVRGEIGPVDWNLAALRTSAALREVVGRERHDGFWNINLPHTRPGDTDSARLTDCAPGRSPLPAEFKSEVRSPNIHAFHPTGNYQSRTQDPASDVEICFSGNISISHVPI